MTREEFDQLKPGDKVVPYRDYESLMTPQKNNGGYLIVEEVDFIFLDPVIKVEESDDYYSIDFFNLYQKLEEKQ
jgi:hypothetical protein